jgi:hypothetical protein
MHDGGNSAGLNPILNSLAGFIPRASNANKPHSSALNGNYHCSQGMYQIMREFDGNNSISMVEFSSGVHAYWELGLPGVLILPFISGVYIMFFARLVQNLNFAAIPLIMLTFKPFGYVDPKIWVSDIISQIYQVVFPLLSLFIVLGRKPAHKNDPSKFFYMTRV